MITWSESALGRGGLTPESADQLVALAAEIEANSTVCEWRWALPSESPALAFHCTAQSIRRYSKLAESMGYRRADSS